MSDTFCILPFIHLEARSDSFVAPCCMSVEFYTKDDGTRFSLLNDTLSDVWKSKSIHKLRGELSSGIQSTACQSCWKEEKNGKQSKRQRENKRWGTEIVDVPKFLDLKLGNTCNLKCRICTPGSSSMWVKEHAALTGGNIATYTSKIILRDVTAREVMQWPEYNDGFWNDIDAWLPTITLFEIYGGEPFLIKRQFDLLSKSAELGYSKHQTVHYNTNGTIYPEFAIANIWPKFKSVDIMLSIDGIGKQFEYQRHPAKWADVEANLDKFLLTMGDAIQICLTVSSFNVFYLPEYIDYFSKKNVRVWVNTLYHPAKMSIRNLPRPVKIKVAEKLQSLVGSTIITEPILPLIEYMCSEEDTPQMFSDFLATVAKHDEYRNERYSDYFPEFWELLQQHR